MKTNKHNWPDPPARFVFKNEEGEPWQLRLTAVNFECLPSANVDGILKFWNVRIAFETEQTCFTLIEAIPASELRRFAIAIKAFSRMERDWIFLRSDRLMQLHFAWRKALASERAHEAPFVTMSLLLEASGPPAVQLSSLGFPIDTRIEISGLVLNQPLEEFVAFIEALSESLTPSKVDSGDATDES